jgi:putative membrane-bound dehydrogenase-like protein
MIRGWLVIFSLIASAGSTVAADAPAPLAEAAGRFKLPEGFQATLFAGEPDVVQPIAFTFDDRGRLWVVENHSYPGWKDEKKDRVLILEDTDGDGRFDVRKVFLENGSNLSGIEWGFGGVWLCSTPNLMFVPDANSDDIPDGEPVVKLDGWDITARHNVSSSLAWGVDGWLYGCNGILSNSRLGKPGTLDAARTAMNCGVWRYHPTREIFEVVAHGTTNPWGLDFDQYGQTFITNCVIQHLWHVVPGARFQRMFGQDYNPHTYSLMSSCADHIHWAGGPWQEARGGDRHDAQGGGHAHVGAMIYLGDNWPDAYRNQIFMCNVHGNRVNRDALERQASGYVARHADDFLHAGDPWFRGMTVKYGPDGGVFVSDWTDTGECHNYEVVDRTNGRIYKITYGMTKPWQTDLAKKTNAELMDLVRHKNQWIGRHATRILQERAVDKRIDPGPLAKMMREESTDVGKLQLIWALRAIGAADGALLLDLMDSKHDVVRAWAVQLELEDREASPRVLARMADLAKNDPSAWVRLALAAGLQRLQPFERWTIATELAARAEDAADTNLALMNWYALEPLVTYDTARALRLAANARIPLVRQYIARRLATGADPTTLVALVAAVSKSDEAMREDFLAGIYQALAGRRRVAAPAGWSELSRQLAASKVPAVRRQAMLLAVIFGDRQAMDDLNRVVADAKAEPEVRCEAIAALAQSKVAELPRLLQPLLADSQVRLTALRALAGYNDDETPRAILTHYASFDLAARQEAIAALASRANWALLLLDAVDQSAIPRGDVSAFHVQQLQSLANPQVGDRLAKVWGAARPTAADRAALVVEYKQRLNGDVLATADRSRGRAVFAKTCAACHTLFDAGGKIGPELTGSQRNNLDYVLSNVLDPSAVLAKDYQMHLIQTNDGRVLSGIIKSEDDNAITVQTATELVVVPKGEIEMRQETANSMMPDGLLLSLSPDEVRDLVGYLASPSQVPLPN